MDQDQRIVVDVDDARLRCDLLGHLMRVVEGGQSRSDVEELPDSDLRGQVTDGTDEERA
jgi:hypothetical protein